MAKQTFLRDRVAAVSNRVAIVQNGQKLDVLERGRRFIKVKTEKGEIGWIEERAVVAPATVSGFQDLARRHASDPVVATAVLRDDLYMHLQPGRDTERFYLLPENEKLQLLVRASVPRALPPQAAPSAVHPPDAAGARQLKTAAKDKGPGAAAHPGPSKASGPHPPLAGHGPPAPAGHGPGHKAGGSRLPQPPPEVPAMDDWWLARDSHGRVGWLLARRMDVDVPDAIAGYAEGQKMVGAYVLQKVSDPDSNLPGNLVPEYVSVLSPYKDGSPYDFDQVRVFTWNLRKHRYETAFRQRNLQGYLPVTVEVQTLDSQGPVPTFRFEQGIGDAVVIDPQTGAVKAAQTETETYRLDGVMVKKVAAPKQSIAGPTAQSPDASTPPAAKASSTRGHKHRRAAPRSRPRRHRRR